MKITLTLRNISNNLTISSARVEIHSYYKDISPAEVADKPEKAPKIVNEGLGLVDFATIPHWNNPEFQPALEKIKKIAKDQNIKTYEINDDQALFLDNEKIEII